MKVRRVRRVCPSRINSRTTRDLCFMTLHLNNFQRNLLSFYSFLFSFCPLSREAGDIGADKGAQGGGAGPQ